MTDAQWLLLLVALIYVSDCFVWLRPGQAAVVIPLRGRPFVRLQSSWGNERGGLAFITLIPARAVFICGGESFEVEQDRVAAILRANRGLHVVCVAVFVALFAAAPALSWQFGFARIGLLVIAAFLLMNVVVSLLFFRAHKRIDPTDRTHRWVHGLVMLVATPSAIRAADQATRHALRDCDPLAVAAQVAGASDPVVKRMLRELAHPPGPRYEAARRAGLTHVEEPPPRTAGATAYCPRCLAQYGGERGECADCGLGLLQLPHA